MFSNIINLVPFVLDVHQILFITCTYLCCISSKLFTRNNTGLIANDSVWHSHSFCLNIKVIKPLKIIVVYKTVNKSIIKWITNKMKGKQKNYFDANSVKNLDWYDL